MALLSLQPDVAWTGKRCYGCLLSWSAWPCWFSVHLIGGFDEVICLTLCTWRPCFPSWAMARVGGGCVVWVGVRSWGCWHADDTPCVSYFVCAVLVLQVCTTFGSTQGVHRVLGVPVSYRCDHGQFVCCGVDVFAPANLCVTALFLLATG